MEYADHDLKNYIEAFTDITLAMKVKLCLSLSQGLKELESLGYYHRDLKPDNIFIINNETWKIGDLGLISERINDEIDDGDRLIGPRGWYSPEAMNKYLCDGKDFFYNHDCKIDHQSDIFQMGMIFWYIIQNNAPIGAFKQQDCYINKNVLYPILRTMLNYSKKKRYKNIDEVINLLKPIEDQLSLAS